MAAPAAAAPQDAITVDVQSSARSSVPLGNGTCQWTVTSTVTVYNLTNPPVTITYTQVWPTVAWSESDNNTSGVVPGSAITVQNDGGLHAGDTLSGPQFNSQSYSPYSVQFVIPCGADNGDLLVHIKTDGGTNTSGDAPFLTNGNPVPMVPITAGVVSAAALGGSIPLVRRRRRKHALAET
jgi:hypothetical protein